MNNEISWYFKLKLTHRLNTVDRVKEIEKARAKMKWKERDRNRHRRKIHPHSGQLSRTNVHRSP